MFHSFSYLCLFSQLNHLHHNRECLHGTCPFKQTADSYRDCPWREIGSRRVYENNAGTVSCSSVSTRKHTHARAFGKHLTRKSNHGRVCFVTKNPIGWGRLCDEALYWIRYSFLGEGEVGIGFTKQIAYCLGMGDTVFVLQ